MSEHDMTVLCAAAMGLEPHRYSGGVIQHCSDSGIYVVSDRHKKGYTEYDPIRNEAQAAQLVKRFNLSVFKTQDGWAAGTGWGNERSNACATEWNRAIVQCIATQEGPAR